MGYVSNVLTKFGILSSFLPSLSLSLEIHHHFPKIRRCSNVTQCHGFQLQNMFLRGLMQYFWASAFTSPQADQHNTAKKERKRSAR